MASFDALAEAYVRLRAKDDGTFGQDVQSIVGRAAADAALLLAGKKLLDVGVAGLDELEHAQVVSAQTAVELRATGQAAGISKQHIDELGQSMLDLAGFDDEAARSAANLLLRFDNIKGTAAFDRVIKDAADLSVSVAATSGGVADLTGATRTLGLALQDPEKGVRLLRAANIALTDSQKEQLKAAVESNDTAKEQDVILGAVEASVKGAAAAYGDTLTGELKKSSEELRNAKAELVGGFAPAISFGADATKFLADQLEALPPAAQASLGGIVFLGGGIATLIRPISDLAQLINSVRNIRAGSAAAAAVESAAEAQNAAAKLAATQANVALAASEETVTAGTVRASLSLGTIGTGLVGLLGPAGLAAAGLGALLTITGSLGDKQQDVATHVQALTTALHNQAAQGVANVNEEIGKLLIDINTFSGKLGDLFVKSGANVAPFIDEIRNAGEEMHNLNRAGVFQGDDVGANLRRLLADGKVQASAFTSELLRLADSGKLSKDELRSLLIGLQDGSSNFSSATDGAQALGLAMTGAQVASTGLAGQTGRTTEEIQKQADVQRGQLSSVRSLFDAQQAATSAQHGVEQAARGVTEAQRGVEDANRHVEESYRAVADAARGVQDAQEALNKALQGASDEELGKASLDLEDANLRVADSTKAVADAQKKLDVDTRLHKSPQVIAEDQRALAKAQNDYQRALYGVTDAQQAQNDAQQKGTEQDPAVISARRGVEDATRRLEDANRNAADAIQGVSDAQQRVIDAQGQVNDAYITQAAAAAALKTAQDTLFGGTESVTTALQNQLTALLNIDGLLAPGSPERQHLDDYIKNLFVLAGIFQLNGDSYQVEDINNITRPGARAAGGPVSADEWSWVGEQGPELVHFGTDAYVIPNDKLGKGGTVNYYTFNINYPKPETADGAVRRELARHSILNSG